MKIRKRVCLSVLILCSVFGSVGVFAKDLNIAVTMSTFDDNFRTLLRMGMIEHARDLSIDLQVEDAKNELGTQLNQIQNFIASGVDGIIVNAVDTNSTIGISQEAKAAGIPLVYVNTQPINLVSLPASQAYVGSNEVDSGTLQAKEICRQLNGKGQVAVLMGGLSHFAAIQRTKDVHDVVATPECSGMKVVEEQTANWVRSEANNVVTNWVSSGIPLDAILANNDEMAIGAIQALKTRAVGASPVLVAGIDATADGLSVMKSGELAVTVFQDAKAQGQGALHTVIKLVKGEPVNQTVWVPFKLVTPDNMETFNTDNL
jgi:inositol transport system substrate-binding protein